MNLTCAYCEHNSLQLVRDCTGALYTKCPRCYRANPFHRLNPSNLAKEGKGRSSLARSGRASRDTAVSASVGSRTL
jgi:phage FluMu protein Com